MSSSKSVVGPGCEFRSVSKVPQFPDLRPKPLCTAPCPETCADSGVERHWPEDWQEQALSQSTRWPWAGSALSGRAVHIYKGRDGAGLCLTVATSGCVMCTRAGTTSASPVLPGPAVALGSEGTSVNSLTVGRKGACVVGLGVGGLQAPGLLLVGLEAAFLVIRSPSCPGLGSLKEEILGNPSQPHWGICSLRCHSTEDPLLLTFIGSSERSELGAC